MCMCVHIIVCVCECMCLYACECDQVCMRSLEMESVLTIISQGKLLLRTIFIVVVVSLVFKFAIDFRSCSIDKSSGNII